MLKGLQPGDELESRITSSDEWSPLGTVTRLSHQGICWFTYNDPDRQSAYTTKYEEDPCFIWRFNTNGTGLITYNKNVRIKGKEDAM